MVWRKSDIVGEIGKYVPKTMGGVAKKKYHFVDCGGQKKQKRHFRKRALLAITETGMGKKNRHHIRKHDA